MTKKNILLKNVLSALLLQVVCWMPAGAQGLYGDVNGDGVVNITDVNEVINVILGGHTPTPPPADDHEWVDLGLPSGTMWATCNVGANTPEEYGDYFAWGETTPKDNYDWSTYKWCNGSKTSMTKYCANSTYGADGFTDGKTELDPEDDPAYVNWGPSWRMPTFEQLQELMYKCTLTWTTKNGVSGRLVTGPNGNSIFLPAVGYRWGESFNDAGSCRYWSSKLYTEYSNRAYSLYFGTHLVWVTDDRRLGLSVRAVRVP